MLSDITIFYNTVPHSTTSTYYDVLLNNISKYIDVLTKDRQLAPTTISDKIRNKIKALLFSLHTLTCIHTSQQNTQLLVCCTKSISIFPSTRKLNQSMSQYGILNAALVWSSLVWPVKCHKVGLMTTPYHKLCTCTYVNMYWINR